jgi:uncharacterized protein YcfJ
MFKKSLIIATSALALATANVSTAHADDPAGILLGGIVGGILGSSITKGKNRNVAIISGTILGAVVGDNIANHKHKSHRRVHRETVEYHDYHRPHRPKHRVRYQQPQNFDPCLRYHKEHNRAACRAGQDRHDADHAYHYGYNNQRRFSHNNPWWN